MVDIKKYMINNFKWRCPTCHTIIGSDYDKCPICEHEKEKEEKKVKNK